MDIYEVGQDLMRIRNMLREGDIDAAYDALDRLMDAIEDESMIPIVLDEYEVG